MLAKSGEIAHINRSKPHSGERENAGQDYCTSSVRHGPVFIYVETISWK